VTVQTIKDPEAPLSTVSESGVIHGGVEPDSAVCRLRAGGESLILKRYFDPAPLQREVANITFVNRAGGFGPELHHVEPDAGIVLMEDLGDDSMASLWLQRRMAEYVEWARGTADLLAAVQSLYDMQPDLLRDLYGGTVPERGGHALPLDGLVQALDKILEMSRGVHLAPGDRRAISRVAEKMRAEVLRFEADWRDFIIDATPWHIIRKEGRLRVIDLTAPPVGPMLFQLGPVIWHLHQRRQILGYYLDRRSERNLPVPDRDEFLRLEDWLHAISCVDWIGRYCRDIIGGVQALRGLDGSRLDDYAGSEAQNLEALRDGLRPQEDWRDLLEVLERCFALPLRGS
jgi:aminoglycoside/choline kinase family phosphotransferase